MPERKIIVLFNELDFTELNEADATLLAKARMITDSAYAPYSGFFVGAAALMLNGQILTGTNQENASYPVGICAERVLLSTASSLFPDMGIQTLAISYRNSRGNSDKPVSPCGICRQSLSEFEIRTGHTIRLLLAGQEGKIIEVMQAADLLPLRFSGKDL
jgi:cytidine deaminase